MGFVSSPISSYKVVLYGTNAQSTIGAFIHCYHGAKNVVSCVFYNDEDNRPGELSLEILVPHNCHETFLHEQQGGGHVYGYEFMLRNPISVPSEVPFWFSVQTGGDTYPPQWGRLGGINVINNGSMFRDDYVSYTDWTPCSDVLGEEYDAAQEFVCLTPSGIEEPDLPTLRHISWANIKALYR